VVVKKKESHHLKRHAPLDSHHVTDKYETQTWYKVYGLEEMKHVLQKMKRVIVKQGD
jgi:hypothetical protein